MSTKKKPEIIRETIQADYRFSDAEKQDLGHQLAALITRRAEIEQEKAQIVSQYAARLKETAAQISGTSNKITSGVEIRPVAAIVQYDVKRGMKQFLTDDKKKTLVREEPMTASDYQLPMFKPEDLAATSAGADGSGRKPAGAPQEQPKKKAGRAPKSSPPGETNLGDALAAAAGGTELPKIGMILNDITRGDSSRMMKEFRRAAKEAGWPEAAINTMRDILKGSPDLVAMEETLKPHIIQREDPAPGAE